MGAKVRSSIFVVRCFLRNQRAWKGGACRGAPAPSVLSLERSPSPRRTSPLDRFPALRLRWRLAPVPCLVAVTARRDDIGSGRLAAVATGGQVLGSTPQRGGLTLGESVRPYKELDVDIPHRQAAVVAAAGLLLEGSRTKNEA